MYSKVQKNIFVYVGAFLLCAIFMLIMGGKTQAISGASGYFPDTSPPGQLPSYAIVQVTGWNVTNGKGNLNANTKMKARTSVANVYVPKSLEGQWIVLDIVNGCNGTIRDNDPSFGTTTFRIENFTTGGVEGFQTTGFAGCATANKNIPIGFTATPLNTGAGNYPYAHVYDNGVDYNVYQFIADGIMAEAGSTHRYLNAFGINVVTGGTAVGISDYPQNCAIAAYSMSCPTPRSWNGVVDSWSYSSFYGPTQAAFMPNYHQQIKIKNSCNAVGGLSIYDLDANDASLSQGSMRIVLFHVVNGVNVPVGVTMLNGGTMFELPLAALQLWGPGINGVMRAHPGFGGNNNEYMDLPGGDPTFMGAANFPQGEDFILSIENIDSDNAIQVLPTISHCPAPPTDVAPTVGITQNCVAPYTVTITVNDPDYATNGGAPVINYSLNGVPQAAVRARSLTLNMPDPTAALSVSASSTGILPSPPGGDGTAPYNASAAQNFGPCTYTFNLTSQPQPPVLDDPELPTSATASALIGFSGGAGVVNGVNTSRAYFVNRGGTYNAAAGTLVGGAAVPPALAPSGAAGAVNVSGKPTDGVLGTAVVGGIPVLQAADFVCFRLTISPSSGMVNAAGTIQPGASGSSVRVQCTPVVNRPYLKVYGSDVMAGSGFGSNCTATVNSDVVGFAKRLSSNLWVGAGAQLGVFASGDINSFASASILAPILPSGIAFANTSATGSIFGGHFDSKFCDDDFWSSKSTALATTPGAIPALNTLADGQYQYAPNSAISIAQPTGIANQIAIYIDGNVTINTDIIMATAPVGAASSLPSFYLIVRGNIYVSPGVKRLDGVYVAMPKVPVSNLGTPADGGRIFTCTDNAATPSPAVLYGLCVTNRLVINGSFSATRISFLRGGGSLRSATPAELSGSANIAETFNFLPETLVGIPAASVNTTGQYDSVISLPPGL